jgi:hypothetical protein
MPNRQWLERVSELMSRRGLPADYAARVLEELADHAAAIEEEDPGRPAEARLGSAEAVAGAAVDEYRAGSFAGRFPVVPFVLAPLFVVEAAFLAYFHAGIYVVEGLGGMESAFAVGLSYVLTRLSGFVVPGTALSLLWRLFRRCGRPRAWFVAAGLIVVVWAGLYFAQFTPPVGGAEAELIAELRFAGSWAQLFQFAAAAGLTGWLVARCPCRSRPLAVC